MGVGPVDTEVERYADDPAFTSRFASVAAAGRALTFVLDRGQEDASVVICCDSTGDATGEWPDLWARKLAAKYPAYTVNLYLWASTNYGSATVIQTGTGSKTLTIRVLGISGSGTSAITSNWTNAFATPYPPAASTSVVPGPTMVILAYGHNMNNTRLTVRNQFLTELRKIRAHYPHTAIVLMTQNPKTSATTYYSEGLITASVISELAATEGYPLIDVMQAFFNQGDYSSLIADGTHPNAAGSELWASTVSAHFVPGAVGLVTRPRDQPDIISLPAGVFVPVIGTPVWGVPPSAVIGGFLMDPAAQEALQATWVPPVNWGAVSVAAHIAYDGTTGAGVSRWKLEYARLKNGSYVSGYTDFGVVSAAAGGQYGISVANFTPTSPIPLADFYGATTNPDTYPQLVFRVSRMGADGADVCTTDLAFVSLMLTRHY